VRPTVAVLIIALAGCGGGAGGGTGPATSTGAGTVAEPAQPSTNPRGPVPTLASQPRTGTSFAILSVRRKARVALRSAPAGRVVATLSDHDEFGSPQTLAVVRERGSWLGVSTPLRGNGRLGWVRFDQSRLKRYWTRYSIAVDLSARSLSLRYGAHRLSSYLVTIGGPGSATPAGRFAVTDALSFDASPYYGCCALALSGRQTHLPPGWLGGDRIAIHGTPGPVGEAASHGCIRATDATMRHLFATVPLGAPVFVSG